MAVSLTISVKQTVGYMCATNWSNRISNSEAYRRASGRRHYNAVRQLQAAMRMIRVAELSSFVGPVHRGGQAALARELGVSRATISRDVEALRVIWRKRHLCSYCGTINLNERR